MKLHFYIRNLLVIVMKISLMEKLLSYFIKKCKRVTFRLIFVKPETENYTSHERVLKRYSMIESRSVQKYFKGLEY